MRFVLRPWRRRFLADDGPVMLVVMVTAIPALGFVLLSHLADLEWFTALGIVIPIEAAAIGLAWTLGHRPLRGGEIAFADGWITIDQGRGARVEAPVAAIRQAFFQTNAQKPEDDLLFLQLADHGWVRVRLARLEVPHELLGAELHTRIAVYGDLSAFEAASGRTVVQHQWVLAIFGALAVIGALWQLLT